MELAVVRLAGKQYLLRPGVKISVEGLIIDPQAKEITLSEILLIKDGANIEIGTPALSGKTLTAQVLSVGRGEKIRVSKFKAKSRYRRSIGFRPQVAVIQLPLPSQKESSIAPKAKKSAVK